MQTIKGILQEIQDIESRIEAQNKQAEYEYIKADDYRDAGDPTGARGHTNAAADYEQRSLQMQNELVRLTQLQESIQEQINELSRQKDALIADKDLEIANIDTQIAKLQG
jgi:hypothetical protein